MNDDKRQQLIKDRTRRHDVLAGLARRVVGTVEEPSNLASAVIITVIACLEDGDFGDKLRAAVEQTASEADSEQLLAWMAEDPDGRGALCEFPNDIRGGLSFWGCVGKGAERWSLALADRTLKLLAEWGLETPLDPPRCDACEHLKSFSHSPGRCGLAEQDLTDGVSFGAGCAPWCPKLALRSLRASQSDEWIVVNEDYVVPAAWLRAGSQAPLARFRQWGDVHATREEAEEYGRYTFAPGSCDPADPLTGLDDLVERGQIAWRILEEYPFSARKMMLTFQPA